MSESLQESINNLKKFRFLFVEDEKDLLDIIAETLKKLEVNFLLAKNGQEALEVLKEHSNEVDIVVTDISMPIMNGLEMIKEAVVLYPHLKIIIMTAHTESKYKIEAASYGVNDYLLKPFDFIKFIELINQTKLN
ncbi:response regulator receiver protein [Arcobacter nitrofigilis DSM 7299]|uniref:Response regulator receiver protein n=1 Tax=Arcobacter nitrofigilis (strain ATCC 33309 / DSM 7299 / CCUG 15893 / LMG 7604 / NCTC 12251 / CI) TaxID=572480 RepID=D5V2C2_ARCNC|nr:response regulator [Arcobacter nitrofigilis]ADG92355.1 response regulator receiver protein [Arcobacter nitrofigilis DSM 7299]